MVAKEKGNVHTAIVAVMKSVGYVKKTKSPQLQYSYASEQELIRQLRPAMIEQGLHAYVSQLDLTLEVFKTTKGTAMNRVVIEGTVVFAHAPSETSIEVRVPGEGLDVQDKASHKAMTGLMKYALRNTFLIETGDESYEQYNGRAPGEERVVNPVTGEIATEKREPVTARLPNEHVRDDMAATEPGAQIEGDPLQALVLAVNTALEEAGIGQRISKGAAAQAIIKLDGRVKSPSAAYITEHLDELVPKIVSLVMAEAEA